MSQVALVTGGGRGLGREITRGLIGEGHRVAVTGRTAADLDKVGAALALPGDVTDRVAITEAVRRTTTELGPLDLLVCNAGRFATGGRTWEVDPDDWWRDVEVNLLGVHLPIWAALPAMVARGAGRIVVLGSGFGNQASPHGTAYGVAKTAVHRLAESLAIELAGTGVVVLTVSPGRVRTDMTLGFPAGFTAHHPAYLEPPTGGWSPGGAVTALVARIATGALDPLAGRYVHVTTDLAQALATVRDGAAGTLRLVPYG